MNDETASTKKEPAAEFCKDSLTTPNIAPLDISEQLLVCHREGAVGTDLLWDGKSLSELVRLAHNTATKAREQSKKSTIDGLFSHSNVPYFYGALKFSGSDRKKRRYSYKKGTSVDDVDYNHNNSLKKRGLFDRIPSNFDPAFVEPYFLKHERSENDTDVNRISDFSILSSTNVTAQKEDKRREDGTTQENSSDIKIQIKMLPATSKTYSTYNLPPLFIQGAPKTRPLSTTTVFLKGLVHSRDDETLTHIPYFGDDDDDISEVLGLEDQSSENGTENSSKSSNMGCWDIAQRQKLLEHGPFYKRQEQDDLVKEVFNLVVERLINQKHSVGSVTAQQLIDNVADAARIDKDRVNEVWQTLGYESIFHDCDINLPSKQNSDSPVEEIKLVEKIREAGEQNGNTKSKQGKVNSCVNAPLAYGDFMDSYRSLFCRSCFIYDCAIHGSNSNVQNSALQGELAYENEQEGYWTKVFDDGGKWERLIGTKKIEAKGEAPRTHSEAGYSNGNGHTFKHQDSNVAVSESASSDVRNNLNDLTPLQKSVCERAFHIFKGNVAEISNVLGADPSVVARHIQEKNIHIKPFLYLSEDYQKRKIRNPSYSMKHYNSSWLKRVEKATINHHCLFYPCDHDGLCGDHNCSCITNAWFCTKACIWGAKSRNYFRGCACKGGQCRTRSCPCFASMRECDPDLCRSCGTCSDPPHALAVLQLCRNDSISMRRYVHLLVGESTVHGAGWGLYTKNALAKGDYVSEYVGEVISQEEAERRGRIYDKVNRSYLFNLTADYVVDATRKGNKTRFINHSAKPNCCARLMLVNGTMRIGIFAIEDIESQSELFFDYRYSESSSDNELVEKQVMTVDWMKDPKMAHKVSKKNG